MPTILNINLIVPHDWHYMSDKQLRYVYELLAMEYSADEVKTLFLLKWSGAKVIGRQENGSYLMKHGPQLFELTPLTLAELLPHLDFLGSTPSVPCRPSKMNRREPLPADFAGVPFETYIVCDNYYQGYLHTQQDYLLDELGRVLYQDPKLNFAPWQRIAVFYWFVSLKELFARQYPDFFQSVEASDGNLLGSTPASVQDAMNAQIRALTKGDVTKETEVLALPVDRALTELNAQAREYKELNKQLKK